MALVPDFPRKNSAAHVDMARFTVGSTVADAVVKDLLEHEYLSLTS